MCFAHDMRCGARGIYLISSLHSRHIEKLLDGSPPGSFCCWERKKSTPGIPACKIVCFQQGINFLCDGTIALVNAAAEAAVNFRKLAVLDKNFHHTAAVQLPAVTGEKFFNLHILLL